MSRSASIPAVKRVNLVLFDIFKRIHGDLHVPKRFVVPADVKWPVDSHGMKFGNYVDRIRESALDKKGAYHKQDINLLVEKGFVLDRLEFEAQELLKTFQQFKKTFNSVEVPANFKVPSVAPWPKTHWDQSLNGIMKTMRQKRSTYRTIRDPLLELGFDVAVVVPAPLTFEQLYTALEAYKSCHENLFIPYKFTIPEGDARYPSEVWGLHLGKQLDEIRNNNLFSQHREQLEQLGVSFEEHKRATFKSIHSALKQYKQLNGDLNVPASFVIEEGDFNYPQELYGMKLGNIVHSIRTQGVYSEHKQVLIDLGFDFETKRYTFQVKLLALQTYKQLNGHLNVPFNFRISDDNEQYPVETRGLTLGKEVKKIRRGYHAVHKDQLVAIGFDFKDDSKSVESSGTTRKNSI